jgi:cytochrome c553
MTAIAAIGLIAATPPKPNGAQIVHEGNGAGAPACMSCHGPTLGGGGAPALAGKPAAYIVARLEHYASPEGHNPTMRQVATALTPQERIAVASYIASLPTPK